VLYTDVEEFTHDGDRLTRLTLQVEGRNGFMPASFDGVSRHGVLGDATGITASGLRHGLDESRFLDDPADMLWVDWVLLDGYVPDPEALTGLFALTPPAGAGPVWNLAELVVPPATSVRLDFTIGNASADLTECVDVTFIAPGSVPLPPGDIDGDGDVDLDDFAILKMNFGSTYATQGDLDGDGDVDLDDFSILKMNFGSGAPAGVPEPATSALLAAGWAVLATRRRH